MSDFREGDLVEVTKGEESHRDRLKIYPLGGDNFKLYVPSIHGQPFVEALPDRGWTVTLIERAKPELPTEPGWYLDRLGSAWVHVEGELRFVGAEGEDPLMYAPFTRLEPVPATAKKVAEFVTAWIDRVAVYNNEQLHAAVAAEFGGTDE